MGGPPARASPRVPARTRALQVSVEPDGARAGCSAVRVPQAGRPPPD
jgi:hypothetical protein